MPGSPGRARTSQRTVPSGDRTAMLALDLRSVQGNSARNNTIGLETAKKEGHPTQSGLE